MEIRKRNFQGNFQICISVFLMWALLQTTNFSYNKLTVLIIIKRHVCTFCQLRKFVCVMFITKRLKLFLK